jgi:hypothetical protein
MRVQRFGPFYAEYGPFRVYGVKPAASGDSRFEVNGVVANLTARTIPYAQIELEFFDAYGKSCGRAMANRKDLAPRGDWKFRVVKYSQDARKYVVKNVIGRSNSKIVPETDPIVDLE